MTTLTHGHARRGLVSKTFETWDAMLKRCLIKSNKDYPKYGGRGITVCERWRSFENFLADMGERPIGMTIERIDNNGNYDPRNCRWATWKEQHFNTRQSKRWHVNGVAYPSSAEAAKALGVSRRTIIFWCNGSKNGKKKDGCFSESVYQ